MAVNDFQGFRWNAPSCGRHFKLMRTSIVARDTHDGLIPSTWSTLGKSAQAVLPVLLRHTDERGTAYPGENRLAAMAGLTRKTARNASRELEDRGVIKMRSRVSRNGRRFKTYQLLKETKKGIAIPSIQIDGGNWACLRPAAKSLALAFWLFSRVRPDLDPDWGGWLEHDELDEYMASRSFDFCNAEPSILRDFAGIGTRIYPDAIKSLESLSFICPDPDRDDYWRVYVWPPYIRKVPFLNAKLDGEDW